jgi:Initiation factor 2 subunit family
VCFFCWLHFSYVCVCVCVCAFVWFSSSSSSSFFSYLAETHSSSSFHVPNVFRAVIVVCVCGVFVCFFFLLFFFCFQLLCLYAQSRHRTPSPPHTHTHTHALSLSLFSLSLSSSAVERVLLLAHGSSKRFSVIVVDSRPACEGQVFLSRLAERGIDCTYVLLNAISYIMKDVSKVFVGAFSVVANGPLISRAGTALVCMMAHGYHVPVLVCCETYKFSKRVQTDSLCFNELGRCSLACSFCLFLFLLSRVVVVVVVFVCLLFFCFLIPVLSLSLLFSLS